MDKELRILILEETPTDAELMEGELQKSGFVFASKRVDTKKGFIEQLDEFNPDVVLSDYSLPQFNGMEAVGLVKERFPSIPAIIVTGSLNEETAVECIKSGAADYILKNNLKRLPSAVRTALQNKQLKEDKERAEQRTEHLNLVLLAIRNINQLIVREKDPKRLIKEACKIMVETRGYNGVWLALTDYADLSPIVVGEGWNQGILGLFDQIHQGRLPACLQLAFRQDRPVIVNEPLEFCDGCPMLDKTQPKQAMAARLEHEGTVYGALCVSLSPEIFPDDDQQSLFLEVCEDIGFTLHGMEVEKERKRADEALRESEEKFRSLVANAPDIVMTVSRDGTISFINRTVPGLSMDEVIGSNVADYILPDQLDTTMHSIEKVFESGQIHRYEVTGTGPDGTTAHYSTSIGPVKRDGEVMAAIQVTRDITELKRVEESIRESEERFRTIFDGALDGILLADPETRCFHLGNRTMCEMLGCRPEEIRELGVPDIHPQADLPRVIEDFEAQGRQEKTLSTDVPVKRKDGSVFYADINTTPVTLHGKTFLMGIFRDATERRQMQARLAQSDRLASVGMLAAGVAHEINNPLTYILYNLESLHKDILELLRTPDEDRSRPADANRIEYLLERAREAMEGAHRVRDIVKDLRTFSRVDEDRLVPVYLSQVMESAINMAFNEIKYKARLIKEYEKTPAVMANDGRLSQVFLNLLINAAHAIDEGNVENNQIRVRTWSENGEVLVEVSDTGKGIPAADLDRVFDPFFTTKPAGMGSGLGLSICQKIVADYGGRIDVRSEQGKGTRFVVRLPIESEQAARAASSRPPREEARDSIVRGRILVVDDEPFVGRAMKRLLEREHNVVVVDSGEEAQSVIESDRDFDVILCDLLMPNVTGMDLHAWLQVKQPDLARRIVFLTGGAFTPRAKAFLQQVPNARFEKPVETKNLLEIVRNLVTKRRRSDG